MGRCLVHRRRPVSSDQSPAPATPAHRRRARIATGEPTGVPSSSSAGVDAGQRGRRESRRADAEVDDEPRGRGRRDRAAARRASVRPTRAPSRVRDRRRARRAVSVGARERADGDVHVLGRADVTGRARVGHDRRAQRERGEQPAPADDGDRAHGERGGNRVVGTRPRDGAAELDDHLLRQAQPPAPPRPYERRDRRVLRGADGVGPQEQGPIVERVAGGVVGDDEAAREAAHVVRDRRAVGHEDGGRRARAQRAVEARRVGCRRQVRAGRTEGAIERVRAAPGVQCRHERGERGRVRRAGQQTEVGETHRGAAGADVRVMVR